MVRGERMMITGVPVLGRNHMGEGASDPVDHRHHFLPARHGESPSIAEIILYVNHQQNVAIRNLDSICRNYSASESGASHRPRWASWFDHTITHGRCNLLARVIEALQNLRLCSPAMAAGAGTTREWRKAAPG